MKALSSEDPSAEKTEGRGTNDARTAKSRRCFHRVISGLERGGQFRFLTLTSSNQSPDTCQRSWRVLYMRLKRRGLIEGYIKVPEPSKNGKQHLHVLFRGEYILQALISEMWQEIHGAKIVDIRKVKGKRTKAQLAGYMAKYMAKDNTFRYSWSWGWVWRGFVRDWEQLKRNCRELSEQSEAEFRKTLLHVWRLWLHLGHDAGWSILDKHGLLIDY
jgi:hypothetical protein